MKPMLPLSSKEFALFQKLVMEESGIQFEENRCQSLHFALWKRLQKRHFQSYEEYYHFLKHSPQGPLEFQKLLDLITNTETHFFRNQAQFEVLKQFVLPEIIGRKERLKERRIRCWSAGCSTGDEAYSMAMVLKETLPFHSEWDISILATDINRNALAHARKGVYSEKNLAQIPKDYRLKYFNLRDSGYDLNPEIKRSVQFEYHNLVKGPFLDERMRDIDILFCRNVLIYFDPQMTQKVIENFFHCLSPEGYLFLGHAETLWQITDQFESVEFPHTFIFRKGRQRDHNERLMPIMTLPERSLNPSPHCLEFGSEINQREDYFPAQFRKDIPHGGSGKPKIQNFQSYFSLATRLANEAKYQEAYEVLSKIITEDNLNGEAYYLLGVLSYKTGNPLEAESHFRKVLYVNPDSPLAYFNLGTIYLSQGRVKEAIREFQNTIRLLERKSKDEPIGFCEDFNVEFLLRACQKTLIKISNGGR